MKHHCKSSHRGFSLVELLVVITVITLLISLLMPSLDKAREQARRTICSGNLHGIFVASAAYTADYKAYLPNVGYDYLTYPSVPGMYGNSASANNGVWNNYGSQVANAQYDASLFPTGLWQLIHGNYNAPLTLANGKVNASYAYVSGYKGLYCPSMDNVPNSYRLPNSFVNGTTGGVQNVGYLIDYDYRYNTYDSSGYGMITGSTYKADVLNSAPRYLALYHEAANYRMLTGGYIPRTVSGSGWQQKWAHLEGGNIMRFDGSYKWYLNNINQSAGNFYGNPFSWPTNNNVDFYYYNYGGTMWGLDAFMSAAQ
jgi:prepilin-type N-terminal cleavage/methylation domain-containing protein